MYKNAWPRKSLEERFLKYVIKTKTCWKWIGATDSCGYGHLGTYDPIRTMLKAHRISYELYKGKIPKGMCVCHTCDNPPCTNPQHLFLGTNSDNMIDRENKNRTAKAEKHSHAKLTWKNVNDIRKFYSTGEYTQKELGKLFGVGHPNISRIVNHIFWK